MQSGRQERRDWTNKQVHVNTRRMVKQVDGTTGAERRRDCLGSPAYKLGEVQRSISCSYVGRHAPTGLWMLPGRWQTSYERGRPCQECVHAVVAVVPDAGMKCPAGDGDHSNAIDFRSSLHRRPRPRGQRRYTGCWLLSVSQSVWEGLPTGVTVTT